MSLTPVASESRRSIRVVKRRMAGNTERSAARSATRSAHASSDSSKRQRTSLVMTGRRWTCVSVRWPPVPGRMTRSRRSGSRRAAPLIGNGRHGYASSSGRLESRSPASARRSRTSPTAREAAPALLRPNRLSPLRVAATIRTTTSTTTVSTVTRTGWSIVRTSVASGVRRSSQPGDPRPYRGGSGRDLRCLRLGCTARRSDSQLRGCADRDPVRYCVLPTRVRVERLAGLAVDHRSSFTGAWRST